MSLFPFFHTASSLKPNLKDRVPAAGTSTLSDQRPPSPRQKRHTEPSCSTFDTESKLKWQRWTYPVPKEAVSIDNTYADRKDYICKYMCHAGFYNPDLGSYCYYPHRGEVHKDHSFEILVNEDNFEMLEWKAGNGGSVPQHSVRTCASDKIYVGKNEYGLGKVRPSSTGFFLPWKATEYKYDSYQVLAIRRDVKKEHLSNIKYDNKATITQFPPESMHMSTIVNRDCSPVSKTVDFKKTYQVERRWDVDSSSSALFSEKRSVSAVVPVMNVATAEGPTTQPKNLTVEVSLESSVQHFDAVKNTADFSRSTSLNLTVPANHFSRVYVMEYKHKAKVPFTAHLKRTYSNGETTWMNVTGTYEAIWTGEVQVVVDRCKPVANAEPCPENPDLEESCSTP